MSQEIYTFSIPDRKKADQIMVAELKEKCRKEDLNFSSIVVQAIKNYVEESLEVTNAK